MPEFSSPPSPCRPQLRWPDGKRLAVWIVPNVEYYELYPLPGQQINPYPRAPVPEFLEYGNVDYGNRVGIHRLFDVFDRFGLPITCSLNMGVPDRFPEVYEAIAARGWEVMSHGLYNTRYLWGLSEEQEREEIGNTIKDVQRLFGQQMRGYFPAYSSWTHNTDRILAELDIQYTPDHGADDRPTWAAGVGDGHLLRLPYCFDVNDGINFRSHFEIDWFVRSVTDFFDRLYEDAATSGAVMALPAHAFYLGQPHRIGGLVKILTHFSSRQDVWFATGGAIADAYLALEKEAGNA